MHVEFLVEEPSAEVTLGHLLPRLLGGRATFAIHAHQGKPDLLQKLPGRLRGYRSWLPRDWRLVILIDEDREDCRQLKSDLERCAQDAGLATRRSARSGKTVQVLCRIAIEELEAWFFGDPDAILRAYPRVPTRFRRRKTYRDPDAIRGGTWEALERLLQKASYYATGLPKIEAADRIARFMSPADNRSPSFRVFRDGLEELLRRGAP